MKGSPTNIRKVLERADAIEIDEGRVFFFRLNESLKNLAAYYDASFPETAAVFAATSPNSDFQGNLRSTATILKGHRDGIPADRLRTVCYNHCRDRAYSYLEGVSFLETVKGKKIRAFYQNILNPIDPEPITIDGHAVNIWRGRRQTLKSVAENHFNYREVSEDYRRTANAVGLVGNQVQAITWLTWKRIHAIRDPGRQLCLFEGDRSDTWKVLTEPSAIKTFDYLEIPSPSTWRANYQQSPK